MPTPQQSRRAFAAVATLLVAASAAALLGGCGAQGDEVAGFVADRQAPTVAFDTAAASAAPADTAVSFTLRAADNLDIARVRVDVTGGVEAVVDSAVRASSTTALVMAFSFPVPRSVAAGTPVKVVARVRDGAGNETRSDTLRLSVGNVAAPTVALTSPAPASLFVTGKKTTLTLVAVSVLKVRTVGYRVSGPFAAADSVVFASNAERDSAVVVDTLDVPATAPAGVLTIRPFVVDGAGRVADGAPVTYAVQSVSTTDTRPVVSAGFGPRLEATDTVRVTASDPVGLRSYGYEVLLRADTARRLGADSVTMADATLTNDARRFTLRLDSALLAAQPLPVRVLVRAFATNASGRRTAAALDVGGAAPDTALVVAGATTPLPDGGRLADGLYAPKFDRLYLTNIDRNRLEVFEVGARQFLGGVAVGSRPWGVAAWPGARDGTFGDTLLVANSGGTNVSYVDLARGGSAGGAEVYRYALPNIIAYSVTTVRSALTGELMKQRTMYDFSDRPQYVAATCAVVSGAACAEPVLVYTTTPTAGQSLPFPNAGTVRWENLRRRTSHLFVEHASGITTSNRSDTLEVERYAARDVNGFVGSDSVLVPYVQYGKRTPTDSVPYSVVVDVPRLGLRDTTYVRNSGDFARAIVGEGGPVTGSRALMYDATRGFATTTGGATFASGYVLPVPVLDRGISRPGDVTDYIANTNARVMGVAINFDGALGAVRGDSTYLVDPTLRLQGLLPTSGGPNAGFDFHPLNAGARAAAGARFAFSASQLPQIEVYDTWCYQRVRTIPVREPIVGPIRATRRPLGGGRFELVIVGASARGVTVVGVPEPIASSCP